MFSFNFTLIDCKIKYMSEVQKIIEQKLTIYEDIIKTIKLKNPNILLEFSDKMRKVQSLDDRLKDPILSLEKLLNIKL